MKTSLFLLLFSLVTLADPGEKWVRAAQLYDEGKYTEAASLYREILTEVPGESGDVHFNLGSAYFREGKIGEAIFHFRKATSLRPRDADAQFNLAHARSKAVDRVESKWELATFVRNRVPLNQWELLWAWALTWALFWMASAFLLYRTRDSLRFLRATFGGIAALLLTVWVFKVFEPNFGVVTAEQSQVYSATGRDNVVLFELHRGAEFRVVSLEASWVQIQLEDGKRGWIAKQSVILPEGDEI